MFFIHAENAIHFEMKNVSVIGKIIEMRLVYTSIIGRQEIDCFPAECYNVLDSVIVGEL
jgi:hypothetical protein